MTDLAPDVPAAQPVVDSSTQVLVVEDDDDVRALVRDTLRRRRYTVLCAASPHEATRLVAHHGDTIGLLITDVGLPQMNGVQLADHIKTVLPLVRVIYMSGFLDEVHGMDKLIRAGAVFLQKPFTVAQLDQAVFQQFQNV
jgi:DNA-binding NtrC family response regulator